MVNDIGDKLMNLRRPKLLSKKPLIILSLIVLGAAGLTVAGWVVAGQSATNAYHMQLATFKTTVKQQLGGAIDKLKDPAAQADSTKAMAALTSVSDTALTQVNNLPALPQVFSVSVATKSDQDQRDDYAHHLHNLANDIKNAKDLLAYEHSASSIIQALSGKTGANAAEQQALAAAWQDAVNKLKALSPPSSAANAHQQLIIAVDNVRNTLTTLPDLYTKKDVNGFATKQKELQGEVANVQALKTNFADAAVLQDKYLARDYADLQPILK